MSKDPAFLFYPNDYIGGTMGWTFEEKGAYIELLMLQFNRGHMTDHMARHTVGQIWDTIKVKFKTDPDGKYYNERLELEQTKRKDFTASRRNNLEGKNQYSHKGGHMTDRMENEDINDNIDNIKKDTLKSKRKFYDDQIEISKDQNGASEYLEFVNYIYGNNETHEPLTNVLSLKKQCSYRQFATLYNKASDYGYDINKYLLDLEGWNLKKYTSLQLTISKWMDTNHKNPNK